MILCSIFRCGGGGKGSKDLDQVSTREVSFDSSGPPSLEVRPALIIPLKNCTGTSSSGPRSRGSRDSRTAGGCDSPGVNSPRHPSQEQVDVCRKMRAMAIEVSRSSGGHVRHPNRQSK